MNNILILPDIHGRSFWKNPCKDWKDTIVFLGDYHDPYAGVENEPTVKQSLENLEELVEFVTKRRKETDAATICLLGNHDWQYLGGIGNCRYDFTHSHEVVELLDELDLQVYYHFEDQTIKPLNKFLFSHAGITQDWLDYNDLDLESLLIAYEKDQCSELNNVPISRGGNAKYGSCIWNSVEDYAMENHIPDFYQIFGHTWGGRIYPIVQQDYAMLDCAKAFVLDTEINQLTPWILA